MNRKPVGPAPRSNRINTNSVIADEPRSYIGRFENMAERVERERAMPVRKKPKFK